MDSIKVTSLNCCRVRLGSIEIQNVFQGTDVLLCQEVSIKNNIDLVRNEIIQLEKQLQCKVHISSVVNATCLVTFIKHDFENYSKDFKEIADGRATCLVLENEDYNYDIINVYGPARGTYDETPNSAKMHSILQREEQMLCSWGTGMSSWMTPCAPNLSMTNIKVVLGECSICLKTGLMPIIYLRQILILLI